MYGVASTRTWPCWTGPGPDRKLYRISVWGGVPGLILTPTTSQKSALTAGIIVLGVELVAGMLSGAFNKALGYGPGS